MKVRSAIVAAVALVTAAAGCSAGPRAGEQPPDQGPQPSVGSSAEPTRAQTKPVPAPSKGNTEETVSSEPQPSKKPVDLDKSSTSRGVVVEVTDIEAVKAKAQLPGEVSGPGLLISLRVTNKSAQELDLGAVLVTVLDSDEAPGGEMTTAPNDPMKGSLEPGKTAKGAYLFTVPEKRRSPIVINVTLPTDSPVVVFRGDAPKG